MGRTVRLFLVVNTFFITLLPMTPRPSAPKNEKAKIRSRVLLQSIEQNYMQHSPKQISSGTLGRYKCLVINDRVFPMNCFYVHRERQPPFYGPVGHIGVPDELREMGEERLHHTYPYALHGWSLITIRNRGDACHFIEENHCHSGKISQNPPDWQQKQRKR